MTGNPDIEYSPSNQNDAEYTSALRRRDEYTLDAGYAFDDDGHLLGQREVALLRRIDRAVEEAEHFDATGHTDDARAARSRVVEAARKLDLSEPLCDQF